MNAPGSVERLLDEARRGVPVDHDLGVRAGLAAFLRTREAVTGTMGLLDTVGRLESEVVGAGPLEALLREPGVTDVVVNGPGPAWVDRGSGLERTGVVFADEASLRRLAQRLVASCGRRLDDAWPYADARLPDGCRVHAVLPPISAQGTCLSIRVPPREPFTIEQLVELGAIAPEGGRLLQRVVEARLAFVVSGGTGSGKTTVLSALLSRVAPAERIVVVEDSAELRPRHPHVVRLESRASNAEGAGGVALDVLVRQAMRMRPDRLVVGEVRGREVVDLFAALNTGHTGGASTVHANGARQVPARFEALALAAGLTRDAVHAQLASAIDVVVHLRRPPGGRRTVAGIALVVANAGEVSVRPAYGFDGPHVLRAEQADELDRRLAQRC